MQVLFTCARAHPRDADVADVRRVLADGFDWQAFTLKATQHSLASIVGKSLATIAPDLVPTELLDAFEIHAGRIGKRNRSLFAELTRLTQALNENGIEIIPFKGPVTAIEAYGNLAVREFRDLDFLVRDADLSAALGTLQRLGYERQHDLNPAQLSMIQRIQGQEVMTHNALGLVVEPHTRLTSAKLALDIDHTGLWRRARQASVNGERMMLLAPEDHFILLAIHGGKELWWRINWACDVASFLAAHPQLDWTAIRERARAQGCLRMVLLAANLAQLYFGAELPDGVSDAIQTDPVLPLLVERVLERWLAGEASGPPPTQSISMDLLRLHDGWPRRARYALRTWFLPGPSLIGWVALPERLRFAYVPLKLIHDGVLLPLWGAYRHALELLRSDLALAVLPASPETRRILEMRAEAKRGVTADPNADGDWLKLGDSLMALKRWNDAITCYEKVLSSQPDHIVAWWKLDNAKSAAGRKPDCDDFTPKSDSADAWALRAGFLAWSRRFLEATDASDRALQIDPKHLNAERIGIHSRLFACDWRRREADEKRVFAGIHEGARILTSIDVLRICDLTDADSLAVAKLFGKIRTNPPWAGERYHHKKIRIAYLSSDFKGHVVADAIVGCFEQHDKTRFETTAISLAPDDGSGIRRRIAAAFDRFIDAESMTDGRVASIMRDLEIDIAVDLNGYTAGRRTAIFARRPAPVHVNYLGYPGTMALPFMDYIIADRIVIPREQRLHYTEKVVYLPNTYFPADNRRPIGQQIPSRWEEGLPAEGFVFACHNDERKIGPRMFDIWMRLLRDVEGSVLWLKALHPSAISNLEREAATRGIDPVRLVFAPRRRHRMAHLARLKLADLFLDTLPYNAHASAGDALWAGLPVLTCTGNAFHGRVAASLLHAVGLPELVTRSLTEYERLALALARDPARLAAIKAKLGRNRETEPLFDTTRFTRDLESAYITMWERHQNGRPPQSFAVNETNAALVFADK